MSKALSVAIMLSCSCHHVLGAQSLHCYHNNITVWYHMVHLPSGIAFQR